MTQNMRFSLNVTFAQCRVIGQVGGRRKIIVCILRRLGGRVDPDGDEAIISQTQLSPKTLGIAFVDAIVVAYTAQIARVTSSFRYFRH